MWLEHHFLFTECSKTMNRYILNTLGICIIFALGLAVWGGFVLERHLLPVVDSYGGGQTLSKLNQTLDTINRPCGGGHPCGVLANLDKTQAKIGDLVVTSQLQERDVAKAAEHNMKAVDGLASHLNTTVDALTGTAQGATDTLSEGKRTIAAAQPLLAQLTANGPTGSSATLPSVSYTGNSRYSERVFTTWQTGHTESAATLYVSAALTTATGSTSGCIYYSTNGGSTWIAMTTSVSSSQTTYSAVITGTALANVQVSVSENATLTSSTVQMTVYDIWTVGTYTASTSHTWLLSYLDEQIWRWHDGTVRNG